MIHRILSALLLVFLLCAPAVTKAEPEDLSAPLAAIEQFIGTLQHQAYADGWNQSSTLLQQRLAQDAFVREQQNSRLLLGQALERTDRVVKLKDRMPKLPDGEYLIMVYNTRLERKAKAIEVITVHKDTDGIWRVADYDLY